jgi:hypothetical protein
MISTESLSLSSMVTMKTVCYERKSFLNQCMHGELGVELSRRELAKHAGFDPQHRKKGEIKYVCGNECHF